jgi:hypothetical protein
MKTKGKYKKSLTRRVPDQTPTALLGPPVGRRGLDSSSSGLLHLSITKSREQSENVYENKG